MKRPNPLSLRQILRLKMEREFGPACLPRRSGHDAHASRSPEPIASAQLACEAYSFGSFREVESRVLASFKRRQEADPARSILRVVLVDLGE